MASHSSSSNGASVIGRATVIRGTIRGDGDLQVEGRVEGVLDVSGELTLEDSARVRIEDGALSAGRVAIRGAVSGNVRGTSSIVLEQGARVVGDLSAPTIGIRPGGLLRGHVATGDSPVSQALTRGRVERTPARTGRTAAVAAPAPTPAPARGRSARAEVPAARASSSGSAYASPAITQRTAAEEPEAAPAPAPTRGRGSRETAREAAPPPVMPALRKGARGQMKRKNGK
ncbi:MAG: polymer-forming cytoskeletal protein [Polyangiaceae bacterium]|nr:polymer-forming cytoskeletal protein [Polyangiaceae bacterium]